MIRIIIAGSRSVTEMQVWEAISRCSWISSATAIVSGTAKGADVFGERWAKKQGLDVLRFPADWNAHGRRAGPLRNRVMAKSAEGLLAVWDGVSRGTKSMIEIGWEEGLRIFVFRTDTGEVEDIPPSGLVEIAWEKVTT